MEPSSELVLPAESARDDGSRAESAPADDKPTDGGSDDRGLIAAAGPIGMRLMRPSGEVVGELGRDLIVTQPTWSRDGRRLAATLINPASGASHIAVVDIATGDIQTAAVLQPYFFYTWSYDGSRLLALGPSQAGGTAAFILDETGAPAADVTLQSQSMYVAWEPGGGRLLLHAGHRLSLVNDVDSPRDHTDYGPVGVDFLAPAWVPGTQDFLYVDSYGQAPADAAVEELLDRRSATSPQLLRRSADSGEITDLGPAGLFTTMAVHPSGDRAAISAASHEPPGSTSGSTGSDVLSQPERTAQAVSQTAIPAGSVQIVDLATAERRTVLDKIGLWLEWSPDGRQLLIAATTEDPGGIGMSWHIWDGQQSYELARFAPTETFLRDYLRFADQYDETPRLWSPDSNAITFGANTADGDVTAVARLDRAGAMRTLGASDVSFWSPIP
ncbi:MAG: hypothetical protein J4F50_05380 [Acidimicrobiia bacterium]|nr:hypothetical protein [Acidimicrobiia bacterium]